MPFVRSFDDFKPPARFDGVAFTVARIQEASAKTGPWATIELVTLDPVDTDPKSPQARDLTTDQATLEEGWYRILWEDAAGAQFASDPVEFPPAGGAAFATVTDIATRLGRTLSDADRAMVELLLEAATSIIAEAAGKDDDWAAALSPVPRVLRFVCVEVVTRAMANPEGLARIQEQLGAYQYGKSFREAAAGGGLLLTPTEELLVRRAVHGRLSASVKTESLADELYEVAFGS